MQEILKNAVLAAFPELSGQLHLDRYARVTAIADAPKEGASSEAFRPRFAVDIQILQADLSPDERFPPLTAVPLPVPGGAGLEAGNLAFPEPGAIVVVGFAYGRPDCPIIRSIYPLDSSLPALKPGELLMQKNAETFQRADAEGNWQRASSGNIKDESLTRETKAMSATADYGTETRKISEHSREEVGGIKSIEVGGVLNLTAGQRADLGAIGPLNLTAGADSTHSTGGKATETVGQDHASTVKGGRSIQIAKGRTETVGQGQSLKVGADQALDVGGNQQNMIQGEQTSTVGGPSVENIGGNKTINAANISLNASGKLSMKSKKGGGSGINFFQELLSALDETKASLDQVKAALDVLSHHTHPQAAPINEGSAVSSHSAGSSAHAGGLQGHADRIRSIVE